MRRLSKGLRTLLLWTAVGVLACTAFIYLITRDAGLSLLFGTLGGVTGAVGGTLRQVYSVKLRREAEARLGPQRPNIKTLDS
ncbi:hypothetical protein [Caulobacter endophyticus]|uniref:hypothetical protein n=1 Tax=Caulobacter endophyticus TaxID=2172652 RepID=UPI00240F24F9|nr:hypothetical protein [Caulobacter endophyticus]MDG2530380.1 hypothetical protein [Caulobacter endophyticus]